MADHADTYVGLVFADFVSENMLSREKSLELERLVGKLGSPY